MPNSLSKAEREELKRVAEGNASVEEKAMTEQGRLDAIGRVIDKSWATNTDTGIACKATVDILRKHGLLLTPEQAEGCRRKAEWQITYGPSPDDNTLACTEHVGILLTDAERHDVSRFHPEDWASGDKATCCAIPEQFELLTRAEAEQMAKASVTAFKEHMIGAVEDLVEQGLRTGSKQPEWPAIIWHLKQLPADESALREHTERAVKEALAKQFTEYEREINRWQEATSCNLPSQVRDHDAARLKPFEALVGKSRDAAKR